MKKDMNTNDLLLADLIKKASEIIKKLKRKAHVLIIDQDNVGFFSGKQQGEELFALLEMLE